MWSALPPRNEALVPIGEEAGWTLWRRENSCTAGNRTWAVQPVARHCTDLSMLQSKNWVTIVVIWNDA
jgi:hypothetical protein